MKRFRKTLLTAGLLLVATLGHAQVGDQEVRPSLAEILVQQREIHAAVQAGSPKYRYLDPNRRRQVLATQKKVFGLLEGRQALRELDADAQLALFNALELIESHLVKRDEDDRMVCERAALAGTRRYTMVCMTEAERRRKADQAKKVLFERAACTTSACFGD